MGENKELETRIKRLLEKELKIKEQYNKKELEYNKTCSNIINLEIEVEKLSSNLKNRHKKVENNYFIKISVGVIIFVLITLKLLISMSNLVWLLSTVVVYLLSVSGIKTISKRLGSSNIVRDKDILTIRREIVEKNNNLINEKNRCILLKNEKDKLEEVYIFTREMKHDEMFKLQEEKNVNNRIYVRTLKK